MEPQALPEMTFTNDAVNPKNYVAPGTGSTYTLGVMLIGLLYLIITIATIGFALIPLLFSPLIAYFNNRKAMALIHGSGICISENQMPNIHNCVRDFAERLGMQKLPQVYIVEDSVLNAAAVRFGKRDVILLTDDMIHGCLISDTKESLGFIIGHELAHVALGHLGSFRQLLAQTFKKLSRLDEFTADAVATALVDDKRVAIKGLIILTAGPQIAPYVSAKGLVQQSQEVEKDKYTKKAERPLTHPLLLRRIHRVAAS